MLELSFVGDETAVFPEFCAFRPAAAVSLAPPPWGIDWGFANAAQKDYLGSMLQTLSSLSDASSWRSCQLRHDSCLPPVTISQTFPRLIYGVVPELFNIKQMPKTFCQVRRITKAWKLFSNYIIWKKKHMHSSPGFANGWAPPSPARNPAPARLNALISLWSGRPCAEAWHVTANLCDFGSEVNNASRALPVHCS